MNGHFIDENNYVIGEYRISNEISESLLYIYKNNELVTTIEMPEFWEEYLLAAQEVNKETELRFENYIKLEVDYLISRN